MGHRKSLVIFVAVLFAVGFVPYLTQDAFADVPAITAFTANDPDDLDTVYSNDDTFTLAFSLPINVTASATMSQGAIDGAPGGLGGRRAETGCPHLHDERFRGGGEHLPGT